MIKNNNIQILNVEEVIKNIDSYSKTTGIMINEIKVTDDNKLLLLIFDYKIIIINETDLIFFKVFFDRIKGQTTLFFKNAQFKDKFEEMLRKGQNDQKQIQINQTHFSQKIRRKIIKLIIRKSQLRTINRRYKMHSDAERNKANKMF